MAANTAIANARTTTAERPRVGFDDRQRAEDPLRLRRADVGPDLAAADGEPDAESAPDQIDADAGRLRDGAFERGCLGRRIVVEHDRRLPRLLVLFLAH